MTQLPERLDKLFLKLDHMALHAEQLLSDAIQALLELDDELARDVREVDAVIDRQEVEIEKECIRLLALYQPAAIDLRRICFVIKVNNDLERIADLAVSVAKQVTPLKAAELRIQDVPNFQRMAELTRDALARTLRLIETADAEDARSLIEDDDILDATFREYIRQVIHGREYQEAELGGVYAIMNAGRAMERLGDQCTNIAEDVIFLATGQIIRHDG